MNPSSERSTQWRSMQGPMVGVQYQPVYWILKISHWLPSGNSKKLWKITIFNGKTWKICLRNSELPSWVDTLTPFGILLGVAPAGDPVSTGLFFLGWFLLAMFSRWRLLLSRHRKTSNTYRAKKTTPGSIGWFKGRLTGNSNISWENLWFPISILP